MPGKIRVNLENSKVVGGKLYITLLKATQIKHKLLQDNIEYDNSIVHPQIGKCVQFNGPYTRS
jgi:hypothetical protein